MMNFRKIAASSKGRLLLRYFTENTPEPIHAPPVDAAGRQARKASATTTSSTGRDSRATWRPDMPAIFARAIGIDPRRMPQDVEMTRLFEARRADNGQAWSEHKRKLSGLDLVFSPHKSVSLATEFAPTPAESALLWNAVDRAADRAMHCSAWTGARTGRTKGAEPRRVADFLARSAGSTSGTAPRCPLSMSTVFDVETWKIEHGVDDCDPFSSSIVRMKIFISAQTQRDGSLNRGFATQNGGRRSWHEIWG